MKLVQAKRYIYKMLLGLYIFSLAFFDKAIFFGHDSPSFYVGVICFLMVLLFRRNEGIFLPKAAFFWLLFLIALLLSSFSAKSYEKILSNTVILMSIILISIIIYNLLRSYEQSIFDAINFYLLLSILLSALGILQFVEFNFIHTFHLYFPPTNQQFILSGGPGAVIGGLEIFRATGTFAEPSWLAFYLVPAFILSINRYFQIGSLLNLILILFILGGIISTLSITGIFFLTSIIILFVFVKFLYPLHRFKFPFSKSLRFAFLGFIIILVMFLAEDRIPFVDNYITTRIDEISQGIDSSSEIRLSTANQAYALFKHNPLFGIGAGNYPFAANFYLDEPAQDVSINSGFLLILAEMGIVGFLAFILILWNSFRPTLMNTPLCNQLFWLLLTDALLLISYNWWYHPLLWLHLTIPLAINDNYNRC